MTTTSSAGWRKAPATVWLGRAMSALFILFMFGASIAPKFLMPEMTKPYMEQLGWPPKYVLLIGSLELIATLLYAIPRTAVLGAVLMMGVLGGAMATQIRIESPLFSHTLFSVYLGLFMWGGLWLRNPGLRAVFPIVRR